MYAFTNLHGVLALAMLIFLGQNVENIRQKKVTCLMLLVGVIVALIDPWSHRLDMLNSHGNFHKGNGSFMVDMIMIFSNVFAAIYFTMNKFLMKNRIIKHILITNITMMVFFVIMAVLYDDARFDLHPKHGLFGWIAAENAFTCIFLYGFVATFWGSIGYLICINFFPPIVVMNAILVEPLIAQILGYVFGIDAFPSPFCVFGIGLIIFATYKNNMVTMGKDERKTEAPLEENELQASNMEDEQDEEKL